jgi:glycine/D-amino acid oxidase-like deaminating enzyme
MINPPYTFGDSSLEAGLMAARKVPEIGIIGGGLQGVGLALELSMRGFRVELFEKCRQCLTQASLNNEGKVHLGFVFANDQSLETARIMSRGAFRFAPAIKRWLESEKTCFKTSLPFYYVVHRESQVAPDSLESIYGKIAEINAEHAAVEGNHYLGYDALSPVRRLSDGEYQSLVDPSLVSAVFVTPELAVDPAPLNRALRTRLAEDTATTVHTNARVVSVEPWNDAVQLTIQMGDDRVLRRFDHVINASWEDLVYLDHTAGVRPRGKWNFRAKHFLKGGVVQASAQCPSATIVLGPFGDIVQYGGGDLFLSWYPVGRRRWSDAMRLEAEAMSLTEDEKEEVRQGIWNALSQLFPDSLGRCTFASETLEVVGGVILALGTTDIHNEGSQLHERKLIGPRSFGRYHTADTGKWTTAPLFAEILAKRIADGYA